VIVAKAVIILDSWLRSTDRGLEWGSGRSTTWLATRVARLVSVEHDPAWHARVQGEFASRWLATKVDYRLIEAPADQMAEPRDHPYAGVVDAIENDTLDFILVDGQMRLRCAEKALAKLRPGGLLVLDGANRYLPSRFEKGFTTILHTRSEPLNAEWQSLVARLRNWRANEHLGRVVGYAALGQTGRLTRRGWIDTAPERHPPMPRTTRDTCCRTFQIRTSIPHHLDLSDKWELG
jgi:SAM-dependent methyltransferase